MTLRTTKNAEIKNATESSMQRHVTCNNAAQLLQPKVLVLRKEQNGSWWVVKPIETVSSAMRFKREVLR